MVSFKSFSDLKATEAELNASEFDSGSRVFICKETFGNFRKILVGTVVIVDNYHSPVSDNRWVVIRYGKNFSEVLEGLYWPVAKEYFKPAPPEIITAADIGVI